MQGIYSGVPASNSLKIEIFLSGRSLKDKDFFSKSDPYIKFFTKQIRFITQREEDNQKWYSQGQTEIIRDNLNPNFTKSFIIDYIFELRQDCRFEVYDDDGDTSDFIGSVETTIGKLMGVQKQISILDLHNNQTDKSQGKLVIRCDNVKESNQYYQMKWVGVKLMNTDGWFGLSDPLLRFFKIRPDQSLQKIHETEVIMDNLNPIWKSFELNGSRLFSDENQPFKVECWDWEKSGIFQFIGETIMTMEQIKGGKREFPLTNPKEKRPGSIRLEQFTINIKPSFLDFVFHNNDQIRGGLELNLILAVDFTGSNGDPLKPTSLHHINPDHLNQYQEAIVNVGEILLAYDYDQRVPCYGFGASTSYPTLRSKQVLHCFPLTGNPDSVEACGISQILEQYNYAINNISLGGPTYFGPIIEQSMIIAMNSKTLEENIYTILLILTDGEIHDMPKTLDSIVKSSHLPLSIIIVGIGNADFTNMETLDGDDGLVNHKGVKAQRDLVQFVPFNRFSGNPTLLSKHVLAEIPDQVVKYHQLIKKIPNLPINLNMIKMGYSQKVVQPSLSFQKNNSMSTVQTSAQQQQQIFQKQTSILQTQPNNQEQYQYPQQQSSDNSVGSQNSVKYNEYG